MPQICETRAGKARASRNCLVGSFRVSHTPPASASQPIPDLIARHICHEFLARQHGEGEND